MHRGSGEFEIIFHFGGRSNPGIENLNKTIPLEDWQLEIKGQTQQHLSTNIK